MKVKRGKSIKRLFLKVVYLFEKKISMESSRRDLFIDMVDRFIFKNNQITLYPCFTFTTKIGVGLPT